jgi:hypothetical protein
MTNASTNAWDAVALPIADKVPPHYHGVWTRTLLETPTLRDTTTMVRWMQLGRWHADLRIPAGARTALQGFSGITQLSQTAQGEVCTWHRVVDYLPPGPTPDEGTMVFESADCVIETGVYGVYREIWHRLPESTNALVALAEPARADGLASARLFQAGQYLMRVRPRSAAHHDFEISFGVMDTDGWHIQHSTLQHLEGQTLPLSFDQRSDTQAWVDTGTAKEKWTILEWS